MQMRPQVVTVIVRSWNGYSSSLRAAIGSRRRAVELSRVLHVQRLMRALLVVALDEAIELRLLLQEVLRRRLGRLLLQRQMHALVPAVLLRVAGLDALDGDP